MDIKTATPVDYKQIEQVIREAFTSSEHGYGNEAELVEKIRDSTSFVAELEVVALENQRVVGYGLLSEVVVIDDAKKVYVGLVLAPLAVALNAQNKGIGGAILIELEHRAQALNYQFISILGHPNYYSKFGYTPASEFEITAPFDVPNEAFMIKALTKGALDTISGIVNYSEAFE